MGNCLVLQENSVKVMKIDGKIIKYKTPIKVHQVLSEFTSHHAISDKLPAANPLHPNAEMLQGHLYYLLPLPVASSQQTKKKKKKKVVRFSDDVVELEEARQASGVVRIKLVISKQELLAMLGKEGVPVEDMISQEQKEPAINKIECINRDGSMSFKGCWPVTLETIPELN